MNVETEKNIRIVTQSIFMLNILAQQTYGQSFSRIRSPSINANPSKQEMDVFKDHKIGPNTRQNSYGMSPTYIQSRHFHFDQHSRDMGDLKHPSVHGSQISPFNYNINSGIGTYSIGSGQEGCRLKNNPCSHDYQCCSGKCRCVRWSVMGKMSCLKKCF